MVEPTGYTALDLIGFTDKGPYDPTANYVRNDLVHVGNSTWRCKIDDTTGITPTEGANWTIFIESATSLAGMDDVDLNTPKAGDGLVHNGNDWTNIPIMTKEQWKKNGAYNICPNNATPQVVNQITYAVNSSNKTITATWSTTPSGNSPLLIAARGLLKLKAGITYKLLGCPSGGGWSAGNFKYRVFIQDNTAVTDIQDTGSGVVFTPTEDHEYTVYITIAQHAGASGNLIFKPMVTTDLNATYDDYVPHAMTNRELTEITDFSCSVTSGFTANFQNNAINGNIKILNLQLTMPALTGGTWYTVATLPSNAKSLTGKNVLFSCKLNGANQHFDTWIEPNGNVRIRPLQNIAADAICFINAIYV